MAAVHAGGDDKTLQAVQAEMVVVAAAVGHSQAAFQSGGAAGVLKQTGGFAVRGDAVGMAERFGGEGAPAAEAFGGLREDGMQLVQLPQDVRVVKAARFTGDGAGLGDDIVGGTAGDGADVDGQITETAAVDLRNGRGSGPDRVAALFGRERRVRGGSTVLKLRG